jgi:hypothetical protein
MSVEFALRNKSGCGYHRIQCIIVQDKRYQESLAFDVWLLLSICLGSWVAGLITSEYDFAITYAPFDYSLPKPSQ